MRAWKKWNAEWSLRAKSDVKAVRQLAKKHKKLYSKFRPFKGYCREYRNRNTRKRMMQKAWKSIAKNVPWIPGKSFLERARVADPFWRCPVGQVK